MHWNKPKGKVRPYGIFGRKRLLLAAVCGCFVMRIGYSQPPGLTQPAQRQDTTAWNRYFETWESAAPNDAQLWIDRFNHFFNLSRNSVLLLRGALDSLRLPGETEERFILTDTTGSEVGSLSEQVRFDEALFARAIAAIDRGIALHPDRIDMLLGRAAAFMYAERYEAMVETLCRIIDRSEENSGEWIGTDDRTRLSVSSSELIADYLQKYVEHLFHAAKFETGDPATEALGRLAEREVKNNPADPVALNNLAVWYYAQGMTDDALVHFIRASQADPSDEVLIYNIGYLYTARNDSKNARNWWKKLLDSPDENSRSAATELLRKLDESESNE